MMRFTGLATACTATALAGCAVPLDEEAVRRGESRQVRQVRHEAAIRHSQLSLAYLAANRIEVARAEASLALTLAPDDVDALHAAALVEVASGRRDAALEYFAAVAGALDGESREEPVASLSSPSSSLPSPRAAAMLSNYAMALCEGGKVADARKVYRQAVGLGATPPERIGASMQPCFVDGDAGQR